MFIYGILSVVEEISEGCVGTYGYAEMDKCVMRISKFRLEIKLRICYNWRIPKSGNITYADRRKT